MKSKSDNTQSTLFCKEIRTANELIKPDEKKAGKQGPGELGSKQEEEGAGEQAWAAGNLYLLNQVPSRLRVPYKNGPGQMSEP